MQRPLVVTLTLASMAAWSACPPKPAEAPLAPSGLAGAPAADSHGATLGTGTNLPGAGVPVDAPTGGTPSSGLPPGHPPIDGVAAAADTPESGGAADGKLPPGHPKIDAAAPPASADPGGDVALTGAVLEFIDVTEYTYMRVKSAQGEQWIAVQKTPVAVGDTVTVSQSMVMQNFFSKSLNRTFPTLVMGVLAGPPKKS